MSRRQRGGLRPGPALVAVVTVAVVMAGAGPRPVQGQETDRPDPTWQLRTLDGERFALGDLRGRPVFVNVWASWCPPCVAELGSIDRLARAVGDEVAF